MILFIDAFSQMMSRVAPDQEFDIEAVNAFAKTASSEALASAGEDEDGALDKSSFGGLVHVHRITSLLVTPLSNTNRVVRVVASVRGADAEGTRGGGGGSRELELA